MSEETNGSDHAKGRIYTDILRRIVTGDLAPGQRLVEEELARTYNVSRTPIREILFVLTRDGLVEHFRNRGARVVSFNADEVEQIFDIRNALECLSIRSASRNMALKDLLEFARRLERLDGLHGPRWDHQRVQIDLELHRFIISHCGNRRLIAYLENISLLIHSLRVISSDAERAGLAAQEHLDVVRALLRRDSELAERLMQQHLENSKRKLLELVFQGRATTERRLASTSPETIGVLPLR
jgi:DNA-binding GntR family transcriptional regulator